MSNLFNVFLFKCVPARAILSCVIVSTSNEHMKLWILPAMISIIYIYYRIVNYNILKKKNIQQKGAFGQVFNYNYTRFFHILMIVVFISLVVSENYCCAKLIPFIDLLSGIIFVLHNYKYI